MSQDFLDRVTKRLDEMSLKAASVSRSATGSPDTIRNIARDIRDGKDRSVTLRTAERLAAVLKTNANWLLTGQGSETATGSNTTIEVPLVSLVSAGILQHAETISDFSDMPRIPIAGLPDGDWIALTISGDSMDRIAPDGSCIVINRRDRSLQNGGRYVFLNEQGEAGFKRYRTNPNRFEPESTNPANEPIFPDGKITTVGRAKIVITRI